MNQGQAAPPAQPAALRPSPPLLQRLQYSQHHRHPSPFLRLRPPSPWDRDNHTPSSTSTIPTPVQPPPSYTTKRLLPSRPSSMEKWTTWQSSWPAYATGHGASTGTGSSPCLLMTAQQGACSLITAKCP